MLDIEIFSRFIGLWVMKMEIPEDIYEYVKSHKCPSSSVDVKLMISMILGAPDPNDEILRSLIKDIT